MLTAFDRKKSQTETINAMPLYPTESILWDENQVRLQTILSSVTAPGLLRPEALGNPASIVNCSA